MTSTLQDLEHPQLLQLLYLATFLTTFLGVYVILSQSQHRATICRIRGEVAARGEKVSSIVRSIEDIRQLVTAKPCCRELQQELEELKKENATKAQTIIDLEQRVADLIAETKEGAAERDTLKADAEAGQKLRALTADVKRLAESTSRLHQDRVWSVKDLALDKKSLGNIDWGKAIHELAVKLDSFENKVKNFGSGFTSQSPITSEVIPWPIAVPSDPQFSFFPSTPSRVFKRERVVAFVDELAKRAVKEPKHTDTLRRLEKVFNPAYWNVLRHLSTANACDAVIWDRDGDVVRAELQRVLAAFPLSEEKVTVSDGKDANSVFSFKVEHNLNVPIPFKFPIAPLPSTSKAAPPSKVQ